jgi:uncharacterized protein YkwD
VNLFDWIAILFFVVVTILIWRKPVILVLESLVALIIGILFSSILLPLILNLLEKWGWRENLYTPALIFLFLLILIWGIFLVLFSSIFLHHKGKAGILALPLALIFVAGFVGLGCLILPPFISSDTLNSQLSASHCCLYVRKSKLMNISGLKALQGRISEIYTPPSENEAIVLPDNLKIGSYNAALSPELLRLVNGERAKAGLSPLEYNGNLAHLAQSYGEEIAATRFLSHLNRNGKTPADRAKEQKINFNYLGENLAIAGDVPAAHQALMNSTSHRDNILSPVFRRVGLAVFHVSPNGVLVIEEYTN